MFCQQSSGSKELVYQAGILFERVAKGPQCAKLVQEARVSKRRIADLAEVASGVLMIPVQPR
jgi:hypothetical protein